MEIGEKAEVIKETMKVKGRGDRGMWISLDTHHGRFSYRVFPVRLPSTQCHIMTPLNPGCAVPAHDNCYIIS